MLPRLEPRRLIGRLKSLALQPWFLALTFYAVWAVVATYPLLLAPTNHLESWGDPGLNTWIIAWDLHQLGRDPMHLFDAPIFFPARDTLALSEVLLTQAVEALPVVLLSGNFVLAYNLIVYGSFVLSGLAAYLLAREALPPAPSLVAGAAYAFSFFRAGEYSHVQILSAQWIPFALLALVRLWRSEAWKSALLLALAVIAQALSSFYLGLFLIPALALTTFGLPIACRRRPSKRFLLQLGAATALIALVVTPVSLPYFRAANEFHLDRTIDDAISGAAALRNYLTVPPNSLLYSAPGIPAIQHFPTDETLFPGLISAALALVGLLSPGRWRWRLWWGGLATLGFSLSLGPRLKVGGLPPENIWLPYDVLYSLVPGFHSIRVVGRFGVIETLGVAGLAGFGAAMLLRRLPSRTRWLGGLALAIAVSAETLSLPTAAISIEAPSDVPAVYGWLAQRPDNTPVLELPTIEARYLDNVPELERQGHEQYLSIYHWHPTPSGYSGFDPPLFWSVIREAKGIPGVESLAFLQSLGIKYLVLHQDEWPADRWQQIVSGLGSAAGVDQPVAHFGNDWVYPLAAPRQLSALPPARLILPSEVAIGSSYRGFVDWSLVDSVAQLASPGPITVTASWSGASTATSVVTLLEPTLYAQGDTTLPFDVTTPNEPGRYRLSVSVAGATSTADVDVISAKRPTTIDNSIPAMRLVGASISTTSVRPGEAFLSRATWELRHWTLDNYLFRVEIVGPTTVIASGTSDPFNGELETSRWLPGETVELATSAIIPRDAPPGDYDVRVSVRKATDTTWHLATSAGDTVDSVTIGRVAIAQ